MVLHPSSSWTTTTTTTAKKATTRRTTITSTLDRSVGNNNNNNNDAAAACRSGPNVIPGPFRATRRRRTTIPRNHLYHHRPRCGANTSSSSSTCCGTTTAMMVLLIAAAVAGGIIIITMITTIRLWYIDADRINNHRILVFDATQLSNQGAGNRMKGLYAAHLLGQEFDRTVCTVYPDLQVFFEPQRSSSLLPLSDGGTDVCHAFTTSTTTSIGTIQRRHQKRSWSTRQRPSLLHEHDEQQPERIMKRLVILDYQIVDECHVQRVLASSVPVVVLSGNTYPRWPHPPPPSQVLLEQQQQHRPPLNFDDLYRPRPEFLLRFNNNDNNNNVSSTTVVVHLRSPDDVTLDPRDGLEDEASLRQMERLVLLPPSSSTNTKVVLVTNNVSLYQRFSQCCHWSHANWTVVAHSANGVVWDNDDDGKTSSFSSSSLSLAHHHHQQHSKRRRLRPGRKTFSPHDRKQQNFQLWMDWYTIYRADVVYHTRSAFSESAHLWATAASGRQTSYVFAVVTGRLVAQNEDHDEEDAAKTTTTLTTTLPLSQRHQKDLQHCGLYEQRVRDNEALFHGLDFIPNEK